MRIVPLQPIPAQTVNVNLANQNTQIEVYQTDFGMFMDVAVNNSPIINSVLCENLNRIVRDAYLGFAGDFCFIDNQGSEDPVYTGLGSRFSLAYLEVADMS